MNEARHYGLLGDPVNHSLSPRLYRAAFSVLRLPAEYEAYRVARGERNELRRKMLELGASGGGNVTVPHKQLAAEQLAERSVAVDRTGACNCFWLDSEGRLAGDNTDVRGFMDATADLRTLQLEGGSVLLIGAGGAARAVAVACSESDVRRLTVYNRSVEKAEGLISDLAIGSIAQVATHRRIATECWDLVVNATSLGLSASDELPLVLDSERFRFAMDLVYGPGGTRWTRHAADLSIPAIDGLSMLVSQAVRSLERWVGPLPDRRSVARAMWDSVAAEPAPGSR
jgi:shikimate dehydrogenase